MAVTTDPSKTGISETDALALTGTTLAPNVVNASLNSITPAGGTLAVNGPVVVIGGSYVGPSNGQAYFYASSALGLVAHGRGSTSDITLLNGDGTEVARVPTLTTNLLIGQITNPSSYKLAVTGNVGVTGIQTITANSASPGLEISNSGGGFSARFGGVIYATAGMLTNDDIGIWAGDSAKKIGFDGAGNVKATTNLSVGANYIAGSEQTAPAAPAANGYRIFAQDNGAGKTQLMVIFATGAAQQIAIEP